MWLFLKKKLNIIHRKPNGVYNPIHFIHSNSFMLKSPMQNQDSILIIKEVGELPNSGMQYSLLLMNSGNGK